MGGRPKERRVRAGGTVVFRKSPRLLAVFLVLGIAVAVQGAATTAFFFLGEDAYDRMRPVGAGLGVFLALIGAWFAFSAWRRLRGPEDAVVVGPAGLHDHAISDRPIPWRDIRNIRVRSTRRGGPFVAFDLADGADRRAGVRRWPRFAVHANRLFGYDYYVFRMGTDAWPDRLVEAIRPYAQVHGAERD